MLSILGELNYTLDLNKLDLKEEGKLYYYSKISLGFSLLTELLLLVSGILLVIYCGLTPFTASVSIGLFILSMFAILWSTLPKLLYKNPLFIVNGNFLICTKNDSIYDLEKAIVLAQMNTTSGYILECLSIRQRDKTKQFDEDTFYIKNSKNLKYTICQIKGIDILPSFLLSDYEL